MLKKIILFFSFIVMSITMWPIKWSPIVGSKVRIVDSILDETEKKINNFEFDNTLEASFNTLPLSEDIGYKQGVIKSYIHIASILLHYQDYEEALQFLSFAEGTDNIKKHPQQMTQIHKLKAEVLFQLGDNNHALIELYKALNIATKISDYHNQILATSQIYEKLSDIYIFMYDKELALVYINKNNKLLENMDESLFFENKIGIFNSLCDLHLSNNNADSARFYIDKSLAIIEKYNYRNKSKPLKSLGDLQLNDSNYELALATYTEALDNASELGIYLQIPILHDKIATVYKQMGINDSVTAHLNKKINFRDNLLNHKANIMSSSAEVIAYEEMRLNNFSNNNNLLIIIFLVVVIGSAAAILILRRKRATTKSQNEDSVAEDNVDNTPADNIISLNEVIKYKEEQSNLAIDYLIKLAKKDSPQFIEKFKKVYPDFYDKLINLDKDLTLTDIKLCAMTYLSFSTNDIAEFTSVKTRTVQTRRSRFRKKIGLDSDTDLYLFLHSL